MSTAKERTVESYLVDRVKARGGIAVKLSPAGYVGIPDRLVLLQGRVVFCELKRPTGGRVAPLQRYWAQLLEGLGHETAICSCRVEVDEMLDRAAPPV